MSKNTFKKNSIIQSRGTPYKVVEKPAQDAPYYLVIDAAGNLSELHKSFVKPATQTARRQWKESIKSLAFTFAKNELVRYGTLPGELMMIESMEKDDEGDLYNGITAEGFKLTFREKQLTGTRGVLADQQRYNKDLKAFARATREEPFERGKEFIVLYDSGDDTYEQEKFAGTDYPNIFHSEEAAVEAIKAVCEKDKDTQALETPDGMDYFIAEIIRPVKITYETTVKMEVK